MANPYIDIKNQISGDGAIPSPTSSAGPNPYELVKQGQDWNQVYDTRLPEPPTSYSKQVKFKSEADKMAVESAKANSFGNMFKETVTGIPRGAFDIAKTIIDEPSESAQQLILGLGNGLSFGATNYLGKKYFIAKAKEKGYTEEAARSMAEKIASPQKPGLAGISGAGNIVGSILPYTAAEKLIYRGLGYAAPQFVAQYGRAAKLLADIGVFNTAGQIEETFKDPEQRDRLGRALADTATAGLFFGGGEAFRRVTGTPFENPFQVGTSQVTSDAVVPAVQSITKPDGTVIFKNSAGAKAAHFDLFKAGEDVPTVGRGNYYAFDPKSAQVFGDIQEKYLLPNDIKILDMTKGASKEGGFSGAVDSIANSPEYRSMLKDGKLDMLEWAADKGYQGIKFLADDGKSAWLALQEGLKLDKGLSPIISDVAKSEVKSNIPIAGPGLVDEIAGAVTRKLPTLSIERTAAAKARQAEEAAAGAVTKKGAQTAEPIATKLPAEGDQMTVATNDLNSLQNFIKGSNKIEYKNIERGLGTDTAGNKIVARHEFDPKTGTHTIYTTDAATASNVAHELGHYFDKELTQSTKGLSRVLPDFKANQEEIEGALSSFAVSRLGGNATGDAVSAEIKDVAENLVRETELLSAARMGGKAQASPSERFADAVSEILTRKGAAEEAPVLAGLLKHLDSINETDLLGEKIGKLIKKTDLESKLTPDVISVNDKQYKLSGESLKRYTEEKAKSDAYLRGTEHMEPVRAGAIRKGEGMKMAALKRDLTGEYTAKELSNLVDKRRANYVGKEVKVEVNGKQVDATIAATPSYGKTKVTLGDGTTISVKNSQIAEDTRSAAEIAKELTNKKEAELFIPKETSVPKEAAPAKVVEKEVAPKLDRTPTGKKPETPALRAEKITKDEEIEKFINEKVVPQITGKERIGKSNADILERSLSSDMTEKDFNNILTERLGGLAEDVTKAKRLINDKALSIQTELAGRDVSALSGDELSSVVSQMNQLVEMGEVFSGVRTELSNSFRSLGLAVAPGENDVLRQVVEQMQKAIGTETDAFKILQKLTKLRENDTVDKFFTVWYPAILSGPKTSARNIVGTGASLVTDTLSQLFSGEGRATFRDRINAIIGSQKDAWEGAREVFKGNREVLSKYNEGQALKESDFKGKFAFLNNLEYVGRFLDAQDAYFSKIAKEGEVASLRAGDYTYGLKDKELINKINEGVSRAFAQRVTYRNNLEKTAIGSLGSALNMLKTSESAPVKAMFTFLFPFVKTVANVTDRKIDYLPILNFFRTFTDTIHMNRARAIAKNVGLNQSLGAAETERVTQIIAQRLKQQQMGKFYMGLTATAGLTALAMEGRITGAGPSNKNERDTLMQKGWRPQSIILPGGVVLPYQNLGPLSGVLSLAGNMSDAVKYNNDDSKAVTELFWGGMKNFMRGELDQSFVSGISGVFDAINGYKDLGSFTSDLAISAIPIPAAWTQVKDVIKSDRFEANTFSEKIQNKLGITSNLEPKLNAFGKQYSSDLIWGLTPKMLNTDDPVYNWMDENGVFVSKPQRATKIKVDGEERELTPSEYTKYVNESGQQIYEELDARIQAGDFDGYETKEAKKKAVTKVVNSIRDRVKRDISNN